MVAFRAGAAVLVSGALILGALGCSRDEAVKPTDLADPCALITDDMLARLAPGSPKESSSDLGDRSGTRTCSVDLTAGTAALRGDLQVTVSADGSDTYNSGWRANRCGQIGRKPAPDGPGDLSCLAVEPWDGSETRIDGLAWIGNDYEVRVAYQMVEPQQLPPSAEVDLRSLLAAAVEALPS